MKPFAFLRRGISFFIAGACDKSASIVTGKECSFGKCVASRLNGCEPWSNHFEKRALRDLRTAMKDGDYKDARFLAAIGTKEGNNPYCVSMVERLIDFLSKGHEAEFDLNTFYS